jgi:hypothetical protein
LRVHAFGFAGRNTEKTAVEAIDVAQEAAEFRSDLARCGWVGRVIGLGVPTIGGNFGDGVAALTQ